LGESDVGAFVQIVAVDPKQGLAIRALEDFVKLPDFFEEGAGHLTHEEERKNVLFLKKKNQKNFYFSAASTIEAMARIFPHHQT
jgi:hypothetical protein